MRIVDVSLSFEGEIGAFETVLVSLEFCKTAGDGKTGAPHRKIGGDVILVGDGRLKGKKKMVLAASLKLICGSWGF